MRSKLLPLAARGAIDNKVGLHPQLSCARTIVPMLRFGLLVALAAKKELPAKI